MPQQRRKRWLWLLLIPGVPAAVLLVLFLPFALIAGSQMMGAFFGPVNVWNSTSKMPAEADIQGHYQISESDSRNTVKDYGLRVPADSGFMLGANHVLEVHNLPKFDGFGKPAGCAYNGTGRWSLYKNPAEIELDLNITTVSPTEGESLPSCPPEHFGAFAVLGHSKPYRFWYYVDDPDLDEGLTYKYISSSRTAVQ